MSEPVTREHVCMLVEIGPRGSMHHHGQMPLCHAWFAPRRGFFFRAHCSEWWASEDLVSSRGRIMERGRRLVTCPHCVIARDLLHELTAPITPIDNYAVPLLDALLFSQWR